MRTGSHGPGTHTPVEPRTHPRILKGRVHKGREAGDGRQGGEAVASSRQAVAGVRQTGSEVRLKRHAGRQKQAVAGGPAVAGGQPAAALADKLAVAGGPAVAGGLQGATVSVLCPTKS